ncbi:ATP-dependent Clp protease proteolytic subunit-related protein 1, chloroplastic-like [Actinidia eriantha]|uniref:ATP-dependent Clp protease proteolytic subunit-related protein 1, chloroplastic-like n=1 Tax=Actinidia eriantha TaxID=165200 RepID=UPI0025906546|nr:ATP-dependent Clp protease proteolytic subunit-related protein 1, chloroplastic-like [Actinidia eriantha]
MATSLLSPLTTPTIDNREPVHSLIASNASFLHRSKLSFAQPVPNSRSSTVRRRCLRSRKSFDHIPKQFRDENLKDGLMDNYKNVPQYLYGLPSSPMDMFMNEDNTVHQLSERVTEESISSAYSYLKHKGLQSRSGRSQRGPSMSRSGILGNDESKPPGMVAGFLDARIVYLGMPIVPEVTELIISQLLFLDYVDQSAPIFLYINSPGTQNEEETEYVAMETEAYGIADIMATCKAKIFTLNLGMAHGQAGMLLSLGTKGYRAMQPSASVKLYLPAVHRANGAVSDMLINANEAEVTADYYVELLAKGIGKPKEEIFSDIKFTKYLRGQDAIDYGIVDKIVYTLDGITDKTKYEEWRSEKGKDAARLVPTSDSQEATPEEVAI